jgi:hypothetical protein
LEGFGVALIALAALAAIAVALSRQRKRAAAVDLEDTSWLRTTAAIPVLEEEKRTAPVKDFHVHGSEARVTFDVPLPEIEDPVLNELLVDEATEVVREKRHTLPISEVHEIVVFAGRGVPREVGRTRLPSPGELPPPIEADVFNLTHVARDPFTAQFDADPALMVETKAVIPSDELGPVQSDLKIPVGMSRGLRARGVDPDSVSGPGLLLSLLELFGYRLIPQGEPDVYMASRDNAHTFIRTLTHQLGEHPELDEALVNKFVVEVETSGAQRGMFITDKYGPFMVHGLEARNLKVRFITRERFQGFIDSMALG